MNAAGIASGSLAIQDTELADRDRADTCHDFAFRQMAVANNALTAIFGLQISVIGEKIRDLSLCYLSHRHACALPEDFGDLIVKGPWLNQFEHVIVGHGISLLWRSSGGVKHPHDMPPFRFRPSPTFSDSSPYQQGSAGLSENPVGRTTSLAEAGQQKKTASPRDDPASGRCLQRRSNRKTYIRHDKEAYKGRNVIERSSYCRPKDFRRIATRYDKLAPNYFSARCLVAAAAFWL
jgi:hypothetical protein